MRTSHGSRYFEDLPKRRFRRKDQPSMSFLPSKNMGSRSTPNHEIQAIDPKQKCSGLMPTQTLTQNQISFFPKYQTLENTHMQRSSDKTSSLISPSLLSTKLLINIYLRNPYQRRFAISTNLSTMIHFEFRIKTLKMTFSSEIQLRIFIKRNRFKSMLKRSMSLNLFRISSFQSSLIRFD